MNNTEILILSLSFVPLWFIVSWLSSVLCGWRDLVGHYRASDVRDGRSLRFRSGSLGMFHYNSILSFVVSAAGLHISVVPPLCVAHPPVFIPWEEIEMEEGRVWLFNYVDFYFAAAPKVRLRVARSLAEKLVTVRA